MSNIPTKADLAKNAASQANSAGASRSASLVQFFKDEIIKAMTRGDKYYTDPTLNLPDAELRLLQAEFTPAGWTLSVRNMRSGCTVSWV
jgi:hypothetical protein